MSCQKYLRQDQTPIKIAQQEVTKVNEMFAKVIEISEVVEQNTSATDETSATVEQ